MRWREAVRRPCSIGRALSVIGERWTLLVLREAFAGVSRFDGFQQRLGVARNVLAERLRLLVAEGVLERRPYRDRPLRCEYELTEKGRDLYPVIVSLLRWGDDWLAGEQGPPIRLIHRSCGADTSPRLVCSHCGEPISSESIHPKAGPGLLRSAPGG